MDVLKNSHGRPTAAGLIVKKMRERLNERIAFCNTQIETTTIPAVAKAMKAEKFAFQTALTDLDEVVKEMEGEVKDEKK